MKLGLEQWMAGLEVVERRVAERSAGANQGSYLAVATAVSTVQRVGFGKR